jgi:thioredoxin-like negative regulator of GroEL
MVGRNVCRTAVLVGLALACVGSAGCTSLTWAHNLDAGLSKAEQRKKPVVVLFTSGLDPDSIDLDKTLKDLKVRQQLLQYVPVQLDYYFNRDLAKEIGVETLPAFVVFRPDRTVVAILEGEVDAQELAMFLLKNRLY